MSRKYFCVLSISIFKCSCIVSISFNKATSLFFSPSEKWADKMSLGDIDKMFDDLGELSD